MRPAAQLALLESFATRFKAQYDALPRSAESAGGGFYLGNPMYGSVDAEILYSMMRHFKPRRVIEIGSGFSTLLTAKAVAEDSLEGRSPVDLITIDPYMNKAFNDQLDLQAAVGRNVKCTVVREQVQNVPMSEFESLGENDILFIDSTHVLSIGSDVQYEFLEVLPRLRKGVVVHVHDIFMPREYPRTWVLDYHFFWTEQYLLQAFLAFNSAFEVLWGGNYVHTYHPDALKRAIGSYDPATTIPGSFWIRRVG
jgi:predicted O-methyltransferase YrrM